MNRIKKLSLMITLGLVLVVLTMSFNSVLAQTEYGYKWNNFLAGSPHYYGEEGHPKFGVQWYYDHLTEVGTVQTSTDGTNLYIQIFVKEGQGLKETHVAVATDPEAFPQTNKGNPKVGRFPYKHENLNCERMDEYIIPLDALDIGVGDTVVIAVHAALCSGETAWANCGGPSAYFPGNNWATFYYYTIIERPA